MTADSDRPTDSHAPTDTVGESSPDDEPNTGDAPVGAVGDDAARHDTADSPATDTPTVSVVIPTHFRNERLRAALDSVAAQTYPAIETVVVDDSGERHAESVVADFDARYLAFDENRGSNAARSAGVEATSGEFVQLLDDDDRLRPEKLARQVAAFDSRPEVGVVYCGMCFEDGRVVTPDPEARGEVLHRALAFDLYPCQTTTMLLRRSALSTVFPAPERPGGDDLAYTVELARRTEFDFVADPLVVRGSADGGGGGTDGERSRGSSLGLVEGRMQLLDEYADLYDDSPDWVRRQALVGTYLFEGRTRLADRVWSAGAITAFARAAWLQRDAYTVGLCLASLAGKPGIAIGSAVSDRLSPDVDAPAGTYHGPKQA
ncbi:glycosyltransferase family 2 protein [Salinirubrum litoreum]|uniref:Glycosyltransferase family 2 protein n=1 Tax=Salinirubrum litoreum TaxID=1126234 RepID=A0ABD5RCP2_9EURY|nr:glycosyltransferase family 2 protein [Salinirubrum litoreum]